ncbi:MAG TPA: SAM-dependent DNA methyltransferase, partial [Chromatiaceae bacterium]|nr:SAM-dependent DNA methyltransferase [Chromatiaceae bacterium]
MFDFAYSNSDIRIPAKTCKEVGKILHVGMYIEETVGKIPSFSFTDSEIKDLNGNLNKFTKETASAIKKQFKEMNNNWNIYDDKTIRFDDKCIGYIVGKLNGLYISDPDRDVFGDTLEIFRSKWAKQEGGQFFTDQKVTSL